jgi:tRNA/tmRNA/rRNA uracil-C5-methylase (TrmA/RlmC/RlmD family)
MDQPPIWQEVVKYFNHPISLEIGLMHGWRIKAKLAIRGTSEEPRIGLFQAGSHTIQTIPWCKAHHPSINHAVSILEEAIRLEKISVYNEMKGLLRYAQFFVDLATKKIQLVLVVQEMDPSLHRLAKRLLEKDVWHSIWFNVQPSKMNRIFGDQWIHFSGEIYLNQMLLGVPFLFHPAAFAQAHWTLFEKLASYVIEQVPQEAKFVELYAGVGAMGCLAAPRCVSVQLVENNPFSFASFQASLHPKNVIYHLEDASSAIAKILDADCVLVDPPRKGIDAPLLRALEKQVGKLIYVSCDFTSFVRDCDQLLKNGWVLTRGKGYLLFPGTNHVEVVAVLEK